MLRKTKDIKGFNLKVRDGQIGRVRDFYFDDESWVVRYLVVDTGKWLASRQVLVSPHSIRGLLDQEKQLSVDLTKEQIENSPPIEQNLPVSRQMEADYLRYYQYPFYWQGPAMWGPLPRPGTSYGQVTGPVRQTWPPEDRPGTTESGDPHLRSTEAITGYYVHARDGDIGHVEDFIVSDEDWAIDYLVVDTVNWWPGKKVLVSPAWADEIDWHQSKVHFDLDRQSIKDAPEYDTSQPITRDFESRLYNHYNQRPYWEDRAAA